MSAPAAARAFVAAELAEPIAPEVVAMARAIAAAHSAAARAVLFYGSCLRDRQFYGLMLDFYLIVSDYSAAYDRAWLARANRAIPPNVFTFSHGGLIAKYAVLSEADFANACGITAPTVSVWARFAQPSRLVWAADETARDAAIDTVARAAPTLLTLARPMADEGGDILTLWRTGLTLTYGAELRAESAARPGAVVDADPARYARLGALLLPDLPVLAPPTATRLWRGLRRRGKAITLARLAKASFTFAGGIDYLAWKINRHAGTAITIRPWQRRWPLLGALTLLPRLWMGGAVR